MAALGPVQARFALNLVPNPGHDRVRVTFALPEAGAILRLHNAAGGLVRSIGLERTGLRGASQELQVSDLPRGVYLVRLETLGNRLTRKLVLR